MRTTRHRSEGPSERPALAGEVRLYFDAAPPGALATHETPDGDHGRIEVRRACVSHDTAWLASDRRSPDERRFPGLALIGMVEAEVERDGKTSRARRYYLSSAPLSAPPSPPPSVPTGASRTGCTG